MNGKSAILKIIITKSFRREMIKEPKRTMKFFCFFVFVFFVEGFLLVVVRIQIFFLQRLDSWTLQDPIRKKTYNPV